MGLHDHRRCTGGLERHGLWSCLPSTATARTAGMSTAASERAGLPAGGTAALSSMIGLVMRTDIVASQDVGRHAPVRAPTPRVRIGLAGVPALTQLGGSRRQGELVNLFSLRVRGLQGSRAGYGL